MDTAFATVMHALGLGEAGVWAETWPRSAASFPAALPSFLEDRSVTETCAWIGMDPELIDATLATLAQIRRSPAAVRLAWHCHAELCALGVTHDAVSRWPQVPGLPLFYLPVFLSAVPRMRRLNAERGVPEDVTIETLSALEVKARNYLLAHGEWGFESKAWLWHHVNGRIYRLGRLEFSQDPYPWDYVAFRHRDTRQVLVLAGDGMRFRRDGQLDGATGITDPAAWTAQLDIDEEQIGGHPITPDGRGLPQPVLLDRGEWTMILAPGDPALGIHIPAHEPLDHAATGASLERAIPFFAHHHPERPFRVFTGFSWLLDNQLDALLPARSKVRQFLRELYLVPLPGADDAQGFNTVFGRKYDNIDDAPQETSLQRTLAAHIKAGGHLHSGAGLLFPEDLHWNGEVYRNGRAWTEYGE